MGYSIHSPVLPHHHSLGFAMVPHSPCCGWRLQESGGGGWRGSQGEGWEGIERRSMHLMETGPEVVSVIMLMIDGFLLYRIRGVFCLNHQ